MVIGCCVILAQGSTGKEGIWAGNSIFFKGKKSGIILKGVKTYFWGEHDKFDDGNNYGC